MTIENANSHPFKVKIVDSADMYANDHPFKVYVEGGGGGGGEARVVDVLPETGEAGYIYLVLKEHTSSEDVYDEYVWALRQDGTYGWEKIGGATVKVEPISDQDYNALWSNPNPLNNLLGTISTGDGV